MSPQRTTLSRRGTVQLPTATRNVLGLQEGDEFLVSVVDGAVVLRPRIEEYSEDRIAEFSENAFMTVDEVRATRRAWGLDREGVG